MKPSNHCYTQWKMKQSKHWWVNTVWISYAGLDRLAWVLHHQWFQKAMVLGDFSRWWFTIWITHHHQARPWPCAIINHCQQRRWQARLHHDGKLCLGSNMREVNTFNPQPVWGATPTLFQSQFFFDGIGCRFDRMHGQTTFPNYYFWSIPNRKT